MGAVPALLPYGRTSNMNSERRPGNPNGEPEGERNNSRKNIFEWVKRDSIRIHRPIRLHVALFERERLKPLPGTPEERFNTLWGLVVKASRGDPTEFMKIIGDLKDVFDEEEKVDAARAQLTPLTPEEVETQDGESAISLMKTEKTMSGKINLVEKLQPEQLDKLRQHNPDLMEPVITGLTKRPARKEKAQRRILDIYQRRGEDERRP
jgi:hypothetical protein